jgi:hypothetical protein
MDVPLLNSELARARAAMPSPMLSAMASSGGRPSQGQRRPIPEAQMGQILDPEMDLSPPHRVEI